MQTPSAQPAGLLGSVADDTSRGPENQAAPWSARLHNTATPAAECNSSVSNTGVL